MGIPVTFFVISMINDPHAGFAFPVVAVTFMSVFGILGAALGGYVGYRITRSKDKLVRLNCIGFVNPADYPDAK